MKSLVNKTNGKPASPIKRTLMVGVLGLASLNMTGCGFDVGIDSMVTGITSNLCVLGGSCNGSTRM